MFELEIKMGDSKTFWLEKFSVSLIDLTQLKLVQAMLVWPLKEKGLSKI